jgi:gamma-glutamylcyclotransferase (GGCT)/AIG2-like uncharacterized protein YtfP
MFKIFVYGTLMPGESHYPEDVLNAVPAIAHGNLFHLPLGYPAMAIPELERSGSSAPPTTTVQGVVLTFSNLDMLQRLDAYEQHDPVVFSRCLPGLEIADHQYQRVEIPVFTHHHHPLGRAWAYGMTLNQIQRLGGVELPNGRWHSEIC